MESGLDQFIIFGFLAATLLVGIWKGRGIQNVREYAVSNQEYGTFVMVATIFATLIGGGSTIGISERVFTVGIVYLAIFFTDPINKLIVSEFVAPKMGALRDKISVGEIMEEGYGKPAKVMTGVLGGVMLAGLLGGQIKAFGHFFEYLTGLDGNVAIVIGAAIAVIYSAFGGIRAVTATDVLQFGMIILTFPILLSVAMGEVGGLTGLIEMLPESRQTIIPEGEGPGQYIHLIILFIIPFLNPAVVQRLLMAKDLRQIQTSMRISAVLDVPLYLIVGFLALTALVLNPGMDGNLSIPYLIGELMPVGLKGLAIAGVLSVIMSTADSYLNAASVTFVHDFIKPISGDLSDRAELTLLKICTVLLGCMAIVTAITFDNVLQIVMSFLDVWGPVVVVPLYSAIYGYRATWFDFITSATVAVATYFVWDAAVIQPLVEMEVFSWDVSVIKPLIPSMLMNGICLWALKPSSSYKKASQ